MLERDHFNEDHAQFRKGLHDFLAREVAPHTLQWERDGIVPKDIWRQAGTNGFLCTWADEEFGGAGCRDFRYDQIVCEELAAIHEAGLVMPLHSSIVAPYIDRFGTHEQKKRWLTRAVSGDAVVAIAMTEPGAGSDLAGIRTRAQEDGAFWVLNGAKTFISNGINSDIVIVAAKTDPDNERRIGLFVVERGMPGFERGRNLEKLGNKSQDTAEMFFNDVRVPRDNVLGDPFKGFHYLMQTLTDERLIEACSSVAMSRAALDLTLDYAKSRRAFGSPIASFQANRFTLATMATEIEVAQVFVDRCVMAHVAGKLTPETAAQAKLFTTEMLGRVADQCVQLHGGNGYMLEYPITRLYANARVHRIWAGTSEIMKELIGRSLGI